MIFTAKQLQDLHKTNGHVVLPYGARLTPLASDWARSRKLAIGYGPEELVRQQVDAAATAAKTTPIGSKEPAPAGAYLWWCDGPCGAAKAAVSALAKEVNLSALEVPGEPARIPAVIRHIATETKSNKAAGGVLLVQTGALATVLANRCPSLRAILGTTLESVEQGVRQIAANVLIVEYPRKALPEIKNVLARFLKAKRDLTPEIERQLKETAACG